ncbi:ABC transporter permease [Paenibacillus elgii]|uniref:ABC transporter permease n=1 Tax=Paenibacillus elgii TaxID=189691 RepID=UPI0013D2371D|nr:ABC transporter permease [Paenibacillus elgii]
MRTIIDLYMNNFRRMWSRKGVLLLVLLFSMLALSLAVYFTAKFEVRGHLAWIGNGASEAARPQGFQVTVLQEAPRKSALVRGQYDAIVHDEGNGQYRIETFKSEEFRQLVLQAIQHPEQVHPDPSKRGVGTNVTGFLLMFLMLEGLLFMNLFTEDKENGTFKRVIVSSVGIGRYMAAQALFTFSFVYVPTYVTIAVIKLAFGLDIGFSLAAYAGLLAVPVALGTAFAWFLLACIEKLDNAMPMASTIILLTSLLSGSFGSKTAEYGVMYWITGLLPQKRFLELVSGLERNEEISVYVGQLGYVLGLTLILLLAGFAVVWRRVREGCY